MDICFRNLRVTLPLSAVVSVTENTLIQSGFIAWAIVYGIQPLGGRHTWLVIRLAYKLS